MKGFLSKLLPWLLCLLLDIALLGGAWLWGYHKGRASVKTETKVDTVYRYKPTSVKEKPVGVITVPVHVKTVEPQEPTDIPDNSIIIFNPHALADSAVLLPSDSTKDSIRAVVPITQKEYRDSDYTAWVSGFKPQLDSIRVYRKTIVKTQTVTKHNRFNIGLTGGYGYGVVSHKVEPFVGVGVTWNVFK